MKKEIKILLSIIGIILMGIGIAFNAMASLGNDSVGILYDGMRSAANFSENQLGVASNIINVVITAVVFFIGRRYVNIGTFIYIIPYGFCVDFGIYIYNLIFTNSLLITRILASVVGCSVLYFGIGLYIAVDIGLDPFTGLVMAIKDKLGWEYRRTKILFDIGLVIIGFLMGGKFGVITLITSLAAGPSIHFFSQLLTTK